MARERKRKTLMRKLQKFVRWPLFPHMLIILGLVWWSGFAKCNFPITLVIAIAYIRKVDLIQKRRLKAQIGEKMEHEKIQRIKNSDKETLTWLNVVAQEMWPVFLERYLVGQLTHLIDVNLAYYKPKAVSSFLVDTFSLGSNPLIFHSVTANRDSETESVVLELDVSYVASEDMHLELAACLKSAVGLGFAGKFHATNLRIEGLLKLGFQFVPYYPYIGRLSVAFETAPILQFSFRPLSSSSVDFAELPGIASWLSKAVQAVVATFLVEPNPLVLDLIQLFGAVYQLDVDKDMMSLGPGLGECVGFAIVEIIEAKELEGKDRSGFSDPYVKVKMDTSKFFTTIKKQTLNPVWHEVFRMKISSWSGPAKLTLKVRDWDMFSKDEKLGAYELDVIKLRGGKRHDLWFKLQHAKSGYLHVAITIVEPDLTDAATSSAEISLEKTPQDSFLESLNSDDGLDTDSSSSEETYRKKKETVYLAVGDDSNWLKGTSSSQGLSDLKKAKSKGFLHGLFHKKHHHKHSLDTPLDHKEQALVLSTRRLKHRKSRSID